MKREVFGSMGPVLVAAALMLGGGCGSDEEKPVTSDGKSDNDDGGSKSSKDAGGLDSGDEGSGEFMCGDDVCSANNAGLAPCCTAAGAGTPGDPLELTGAGPNLCGADLGPFLGSPSPVCIQLSQAGVLDDSCPEVQTPGAPAMPGCCTPDGYCGGMETNIPLGCTLPATGRGQRCGVGADDAGTDGG
jgi:hypothetical protein